MAVRLSNISSKTGKKCNFCLYVVDRVINFKILGDLRLMSSEDLNINLMIEVWPLQML